MINRIKELKRRAEELENLLSDPQTLRDRPKYRKLAKEHGEIEKILKVGREYEEMLKIIEDDEAALETTTDEELLQLARQEIEELSPQRDALEKRLKELLTPADPRDKRSIIMEIRAGVGGEEAGLFAADLYKIYHKYAERLGWKVEVMSTSPTEMGGFKEIIFSIEGDNVYRELKYESGVHRVQRVPLTESGGRIHTSAASVVVLPEAEEVEVDINSDDLRIDVFRSSGPGGQSVNTTDSAVRITHLPSRLVITCQDEKSQHKNRAKALRVLRARLLDMKQREQQENISQKRRLQVGTGDRSAKIRTYNFPQGRVTDHRIGVTWHRLEEVLAGDLKEIIDTLRKTDLKEQTEYGGT